MSLLLSKSLKNRLNSNVNFGVLNVNKLIVKDLVALQAQIDLSGNTMSNLNLISPVLTGSTINGITNTSFFVGSIYLSTIGNDTFSLTTDTTLWIVKTDSINMVMPIATDVQHSWLLIRNVSGGLVSNLSISGAGALIAVNSSVISSSYTLPSLQNNAYLFYECIFDGFNQNFTSPLNCGVDNTINYTGYQSPGILGTILVIDSASYTPGPFTQLATVDLSIVFGGYLNIPGNVSVGTGNYNLIYCPNEIEDVTITYTITFGTVNINTVPLVLAMYNNTLTGSAGTNPPLTYGDTNYIVGSDNNIVTGTSTYTATFTTNILAESYLYLTLVLGSQYPDTSTSTIAPVNGSYTFTGSIALNGGQGGTWVLNGSVSGTGNTPQKVSGTGTINNGTQNILWSITADSQTLTFPTHFPTDGQNIIIAIRNNSGSSISSCTLSGGGNYVTYADGTDDHSSTSYTIPSTSNNGSQYYSFTFYSTEGAWIGK
jgi:hypothetical protein